MGLSGVHRTGPVVHWTELPESPSEGFEAWGRVRCTEPLLQEKAALGVFTKSSDYGPMVHQTLHATTNSGSNRRPRLAEVEDGPVMHRTGPMSVSYGSCQSKSRTACYCSRSGGASDWSGVPLRRAAFGGNSNGYEGTLAINRASSQPPLYTNLLKSNHIIPTYL